MEGEKYSESSSNERVMHTPRVDQTNVVFPVNFWKWRDRIVPNGEAYLKGARLYDYAESQPVYWANTSNCMYGIVNNVWVDFPFTANEFMSDTQTRWLKWRNGTLFLRNVANSLYICNDMAKNAHAYLALRINLF